MASRSIASVCRHCRCLLPYHRRLLVRPPRPRLVASLRHLSSAPSDPIPPPSPDGDDRVYPEKVQALVRDISQLTLLETAQLNELLKSTLNIPDVPMMAVGAMPAPGAVAAQEEEKEEEQTEFTVKLMAYTEGSKIKVIKEVKTLTEGMNLVQAKKFVEEAPQVVQKGVSKEEAERLKVALETAGGVVEVE